jgi:hypothetical protein
MRPTYETISDTRNEEEIISKVSTAWNCAVVKTKKFYPFDYVCMRDGHATAFSEIKNRNYRHDAFPTYMFSLHKFYQCISMAKVVQKPFLLIVQFQDGIYWMCNFDVVNVDITGRKDRADNQDIEPCCMLSMKNFKLL